MNKQQAIDALTKIGFTDIVFAKAGALHLVRGHILSISEIVGRASLDFDTAVVAVADHGFMIAARAGVYEEEAAAGAFEQPGAGLPGGEGDGGIGAELEAISPITGHPGGQQFTVAELKPVFEPESAASADEVQS